MNIFRNTAYPRRYAILDTLTLIAGIVLLLSVSCEVACGSREMFSPQFLITQLLVCIVFVADYLVRAFSDDGANGRRYAWRHLPYLLLSLPYLNLIALFGVHLDRSSMMIIGVIPLLRAIIASWVVVRWFSTRGVRRMFTAYALTVILLTYISGVIFYDYEIAANPHLHGFGNAVWWAFMGMTTVGAAIFPVTTIGKILAVLLPALGMLMLPLFTVYVADLYKKKEGEL